MKPYLSVMMFFFFFFVGEKEHSFYIVDVDAPALSFLAASETRRPSGALLFFDILDFVASFPLFGPCGPPARPYVNGVFLSRLG